jgi:hypothetical protein
MKLLAFLDTSEGVAFARELGEEFAHNFPAAAVAEPRAERRLAHAIEVLGNRAAKFERQHALGWYRKSKFMDAIKKELLGRGHEAAVVDQVVYAVVLRMARRGG